MAQLIPTPWIQSPDETRNYAAGAQLGMEQQRLAMESQRMQAAQVLAEQTRMQEQQRIEIQREYQKQQLAIRQQQLDQAKQINQMRIKQAADQTAAMLSYQKAVAGGMDPTKAFSTYGPGMMPKAALGSFYAQQAHQQSLQQQREQLEKFTPGQALDVGGAKMIQTAPGKWAQVKEPAPKPERLGPQDTVEGRALGTAYAKALDELYVAKASGKAKMIKVAQDNVDSLKQQIEQLGKPAAAAAPATTTTTPGKFKVVSISPHGSAAEAPAPATAPLPAAAPVAPTAPTPAPAPSPAPRAAAPARSGTDEEKVLKSYRSGEISKSDAMKLIGRHILGPEWVTSSVEKKWHWEMKEDETGKLSHYYIDRP